MRPENISVEHHPDYSILVGSLDSDSELVAYQLHIIIRCRPDWLPVCYLRHDETFQVCYDLTDLRALDTIDPNQRTPQLGKDLLLEISTILDQAADLLLPAIQFSLDASMIYLDCQHQLYLVFWPFKAVSPHNLPQTSTPSGKSCSNPLTNLIGQISQAFHWYPDAARQVLQEAHGDPASVCQNLKALDVEKGADPPEGTGAINHLPDNGRICRTFLWKAGYRLAMILLMLLHVLSAALAVAIVQGLFVSLKPGLVAAAILLGIIDLLLLFRKHHSVLQLSLTRIFRQCQSLMLVKDDKNEDGDDATILLPQADEGFRMAMLSEGKPGTPEENEGLRAFILTDEFLIGRDPRKTDLCLSDQAIGRMHARIFRRAGSFFICDLGSGNGTQLDGRRLAKHTETRLPDQCLIAFAQRAFYFEADE